MKKYIFIVIALLAVLVLSACQTAPTAAPAANTAVPATAAPAATDKPAAAPVLTLVGAKGTQALTLDDLKKLPTTSGQAGIKSSTGKITPPAQFTGVLMSDLITQAGGADSSMGVQLEATDGYSMTFSYDQIAKGDFIAYDPATGDETKNAGKLQVLVAYEMDGKPLNATTEGALRLVIISEKNNQVTDGHWSVKFIAKLTVKSVAEAWTIDMQGGIVDKIDRGSFESCSTGKCHQSSYQDTKSQVWTGVPLWLLVGRVDDEIKHDTGAYNAALAAKNYTIELIAKDGYSVKLDSAKVAKNNNIMVANAMNGNALTDKDFPLKLVGSDLTNKEMAGGIVKIILHLGMIKQDPTPLPAATATTNAAAATTAPTGDFTSLTITGLVGAPKTWKVDDLKAMDLVKMTVEQPKKGKVDVTGVRINALLDLVGPKADAKTIVFTAVDGFSSQVALADVRACADCLIGLNDTGGMNTIMTATGMPNNLWVKNIVKIELK
jgi:DMSO/TMAO reductase YedYZ molybdopterin-dependent catalytic subunit